jgi:hypothetical protein
MAIKDKSEMHQPPTIEIDLTGPEGNAFFLLGIADRYSKRLGMDTDAILEDMKSSDYEHLIEVFDKHFGNFITLYR